MDGVHMLCFFSCRVFQLSCCRSSSCRRCSWNIRCVLSGRDVDLLLVDGVRKAYGGLSVAVRLIFFLQAMFLDHRVCPQLSWVLIFILRTVIHEYNQSGATTTTMTSAPPRPRLRRRRHHHDYDYDSTTTTTSTTTTAPHRVRI